MRTIMRHGSGIQPHNALTKDTVYVNIDKRLNNPDLDPYTQNMLLDKYANLWENGFTPDGAEEKYVAVGVSKDRGIQFVRQSIYEKAIKADPGIFTGGHVVRDAQGNLIPQMDYKSWEAFSAAIDYSRKTNTPGEDSRTLYGSSLKGKKIIVFDPSSWKQKDNPEGVLGKIPGLDGASFADSSIIPVSAQGRMEGVKTVLNSVKMAELHKLYAGEGKDARALMLRAASGIAGANEMVEFTPDTGLLISKEDIKDFDRRFAGKTNAEITEAIRKDIEAGGLSVKTTFSDADKNSRWMSAQLAQTLDMTPDDQRMFNKVFIDELARAGTLGGAVDSVFAGNQSMQDMLRANP